MGRGRLGRRAVARVALGAAALVVMGATISGGPFPIEARVSILGACAAVLVYLVELERRAGR